MKYVCNCILRLFFALSKIQARINIKYSYPFQKGLLFRQYSQKGADTVALFKIFNKI
jgi:hypothetical protein